MRRLLQRRAMKILGVSLLLQGCSPSFDDPAKQLVAIRLMPASISLGVGQHERVIATGTFANGRSEDISPRVSWEMRDGKIAAVAVGARGAAMITGVTRGLTSIAARLGEHKAFALVGVSQQAGLAGPLALDPHEPRYFVDPTGQPVYLTGSHTWSSLQDNGVTFPPSAFDYDAYLDFLHAFNHNFIRLWAWEQGNWTSEIKGDYWITPLPYKRTGPGEALDGRLKYDLTQFDQAYFDRLRTRVMAARQRGVYVSVMLFNGWSVEPKLSGYENPWKGHPYRRENNINDIDGDPHDSGAGLEVHSLALDNVRRLQEAYVRKVVDTVNDLDNVLYEISNESRGGSWQWQFYLIDYLKRYQATLPNQHPVGMSVERPGESQSVLIRSAADWVSPWRISNNPLEPMVAFTRKVIVNDTDHLCGGCGSVAWVWKSLMAGLNPILMDPYDDKAVGLGAASKSMTQPEWDAIRRNMGYARVFAQQLDLDAVEPLGALASSDYCLASPLSKTPQYLAFARKSKVTDVDLSISDRQFEVEWFDPVTGQLKRGAPVEGGSRRSFRAPFDGDAILYLRALPRPTDTRQ